MSIKMFEIRLCYKIWVKKNEELAELKKNKPKQIEYKQDPNWAAKQ
jgi:hypothetical protein